MAVAPSATPSRAGGATAATINATERQWAEDHDAYRRLRKDGEQPNHIDGAAALETKADSRIEIEHGQLMTGKQRRDLNAITDGGAAA